jgi:hypothetical protein
MTTLFHRENTSSLIFEPYNLFLPLAVLAIRELVNPLVIASHVSDSLVAMIILYQYCSCCTLNVVETVAIKVTSAAAAAFLLTSSNLRLPLRRC